MYGERIRVKTKFGREANEIGQAMRRTVTMTEKTRSYEEQTARAQPGGPSGIQGSTVSTSLLAGDIHLPGDCLVPLGRNLVDLFYLISPRCIRVPLAPQTSSRVSIFSFSKFPGRAVSRAVTRLRNS